MEALSFDIAQQAKDVPVTPADINDRGERFAVSGGYKSNLSEEHWKMARTPAFKKWFGDWEHIPVEKVRTSQGSEYTYDKDGKTSRYKTATGEQQATQDLAVFLHMDVQEEQDFLEAYRTEGGLKIDGKRVKVYVVEKTGDSGGRIIRNKEDVQDEKKLGVAVLNGRDGDSFVAANVVQIKRASMQPAVGLNVYDTRHYMEGDDQVTERHLGNKVDGLQYARSETSQMLANGEPRLFQDPSKPEDPIAKCFIKSLNPYRIDKASFESWLQAANATDPARKREVVMEVLKREGYDGLILDGQPALDSVTGKPYFEEGQILSVPSQIAAQDV